MALSSTSGDAGPNFSESRGCGVQGVRSPHVGATGLLDSSTRIYGPKADFFGRDKEQLAASMITWTIPMSDGKTALLHGRLQPALAQVAANLAAAAAAGNDYGISDLSDWVFRTVWGRYYLSNHALGDALDINPPTNPYRADNVLITDMPGWFRDAWRAAGFCWGGDWVNIKDTMHYSWVGPLATSAYGPRLAPYPPLTVAAAFGPAAATFPSAYGATTDPLAMADRSGDGADDLYRVRSAPGGLVVEAAGARSNFSVIGYRVYTGLGASPADTTLADFDGDGRPDLVVFDRSGATFTAYSDVSGFAEAVAAGPIPAGPAELAFGHSDGDWLLDLFAVTPGPTTTVAVYTSATGYTAGPSAALSIGDTTGWSFAVGDYDVDGNDDIYAVEPSTGVLTVATAVGSTFLAEAPRATHLGVGGGQLLIGDYDGDGRDDLYVAAEGQLSIHLGGVPLDPITRWFLPQGAAPWDAGPECLGGRVCDQIGFVDSEGEWSIKDAPASEADDVSFLYGNPGDVPFAGDWDGDGVQTPGLYRQADGYVYLRNSSDQGTADISFYFGDPGDIPVVGDFDGDGFDTVSLYRPSQQRFYIINRLGSGDGGLGTAEVDFQFGNPGDKPFSGDLDGNGVDDVGLHRESTGLVYYRLALTGGVAHGSFIFGDPGDLILTGDWDGDGMDTLAAYRPTNRNWYLKLFLSDGIAEHAVHYHGNESSGLPVVGRFGTESSR
jgi:hypothetical protein